MAVWANGGDVIINGGTYTNVGATATVDPAHMDLIYAKNGSTVTINAGEFFSETPAWVLNCHDASYNAGNTDIIVYGGKFHGFDPFDNKAEGADTSFVPETHESKQTEDYYVVSKKGAVLSVDKENLSSNVEFGTDETPSEEKNTMVLDSATFSQVYSAAQNGKEVVFVLEEVTNTQVLSAEQQESIETLDATSEVIVLNAEIHVGEENVSQFAGTVTIKYFVGKNSDKKYEVFHVADNGEANRVNGVTYDPTTGYVSIPCPHFSVYVLTATTVVEPAKSTVEFVVDGKVWRTYRVTKGADINMPEVPEKEGYVGEWDHDGENIRTATTITAVYTKVEEPVNNTDLSDYADFQLPVYTNSRVTNIATANGSITVDGYMFKANANLDKEDSIWREIIFVNEDDYSMAKAYRKQVTPVYNTWLNKNMTATGNGTYALDYANYTVTFSNTDINNYVGNTPATKMNSGSYLAYMRISDGTDSYLFPLKDIVLSDGSTLALPSGFEVVDTTTRALRYIVK